MAQLRDMVILVLVFAVVMLPQNTEAEDYTVGGAIGWTSFPPGDASFYSKWAQNFTFKLNDNLVFNFDSGSHSVALLTKANYDKCNVNDNIQNFNTGPARITLKHTGEFFFTCTFSGHCTSGQKLSVKVSTGSFSPTAEGPSPPASRPGDTDPLPMGSATSLAATFSLLLITIALNLLSMFKDNYIYHTLASF